MRFLSVLTLALAICVPLPAAVVLAGGNGGFEQTVATFVAATKVNFAESSAALNAVIGVAGNAGTLPSNWTIAAPAGPVNYKWVKSTAAKEGSYYYYIKGSSTYLLNNDSCFQFSISGLIVGQVYGLSAYMASAQSTGASAAIETSIGNQTFSLAGNSAWSNTQTTVIPWVKTTYIFTANSVNMTAWLSPQGTGSGNTTPSAVVFDDVTIQALPEPGTIFSAGIPIAALVVWISLQRKGPDGPQSN